MKDGGKEILEVVTKAKKSEIEELQFKLHGSGRYGKIVFNNNGAKGEFYDKGDSFTDKNRFIVVYDPYVEIFTNNAPSINKLDISNVASLNELLDNFKESFKSAIMDKILIMIDLFKPANERIKVSYKFINETIPDNGIQKYLIIKTKYENAEEEVTIAEPISLSLYYDDGKRKASAYSSTYGYLSLGYVDQKEEISIATDLGPDMKHMEMIAEYLNSRQLVIDKNTVTQVINMFLTSDSIKRYVEIALDKLIDSFKVGVDDKISQRI